MLKNTLFIDFEGNKAGHQYLVGYLYNYTLCQVVLDQELSGLADFRGLPSMNLSHFVSHIQQLMLDEDLNSIASYTTHDIDELKAIEGFSRFMDEQKITHLNAHKVARQHIRKNHLKEYREIVDSLPQNFHRKRYSLINVMRFLEGSVPSDYTIGLTTSRFNAVRNALIEKEQDYSRLTPVQKAKATKALKHNEYDVRSLATIMRTHIA